MKQKLTVFTLMMTFLLSAAGCGKKQETEVTDENAYVYVPQYISLGEDENRSNADFIYRNGELNYVQYVWEPGSEGKQLYCRYHLTEGTTRTADMPKADPDSNVCSSAVDAEDNLYILYEKYVMDERNPEDYHQEYSIAKYDSSMKQIFLQDITEQVNSGDRAYVQGMVLDSENRIYIHAGERIHLLDADGKYAGKVEFNSSWVESVGIGKDGKVYAIYYDNNSGNGGMVATEIDFAGKKIGSTYRNLPQLNGDVKISAGSEKDLLISDSVKVYDYDKEAQEYKELLDWVDCDINGMYVGYVCSTEDGNLLAVVNDWDTGKTEIACLAKKSAAEVQQKEKIVIGVLWTDQDLQSAVVRFNKSSEKYHISIRQYYSDGMEYQDVIARINSDIISGTNCPDILDLNQLDIAKLSGAGALEDLTPYLEKSSKLSKDSFLESIISAYTYDGKLVGIPKNFQIETLVGKKSLLGDRTDWSVQDIIDFSAEHPDAELFEYTSKEDMLMILMTFNEGAFIDWQKGTCNFNSPEFINILEFVNQFPEEYDYNADKPSAPSRLASGDLLLYSMGLGQFQDIQQYPAMFGEEVTYIGYPTVDGQSGCILSGTGNYAILTGSEHKEGAWAFIEDYLTNDDSMFSWGFPTQKAALDKLINEELNVEYVKDENGELLLDEEGNPIPQNGGGSIGWGDWEYTFHPCTREEIDTVLELADSARPISLSNQDVLKIIAEEAQAYYKGDKSAADVAALIQSRISVYVGENS
ncbi:MAG: extracellular solute-binding protein [Acetatifactor sp.]